MDIQQTPFAIFEITINDLYKTCLISFTRLVNTLTIAIERFLSYPAYVYLSSATSASDSERHQELHQGIFTLLYNNQLRESCRWGYFIVISYVSKTLVEGTMDMDNFHINKYNSLLWNYTYSLSPRHKPDPQVYSLALFPRYKLAPPD